MLADSAEEGVGWTGLVGNGGRVLLAPEEGRSRVAVIECTVSRARTPVSNDCPLYEVEREGRG